MIDSLEASKLELEYAFFEVSQNTILPPEEADLSLQPTHRVAPAYKSAAIVNILVG